MLTPPRLQIGEVAHLLGITPKAIRHYHQLGLLDDAPRAENGYRVYGVEHLERLQLIQRLGRLGLTLRQIGFILNADNPDALLDTLLRQRQEALTDEISRLQAEQARIRRFLETGVSVETLDTPRADAAMTIVRDVVKPVSSDLADMMVAVEGATLARIDQYRWNGDYAAFWTQIAENMRPALLHNEHLFILWMERYLALATMQPDDRQAAAWLAEAHTPSVSVVRHLFQLAPAGGLPADEQAQIQRLIGLALYEHATPLQQAFIMAILNPSPAAVRNTG